MNILITALEIIATVAILSGFTYLLIAVVKDFREDLKERKEKKRVEEWYKNWDKEHRRK